MAYALPLRGRRMPDQRKPNFWPAEMRPGDYWRILADPPTGWEEHWCAAIPGGPVGRLPLHDVEEHADGTITVKPGGFDGANSNSIPGRTFHGWIWRGVWAESEEQAKSLGPESSAAGVDGARLSVGYHEPVGERQGRQPAPEPLSPEPSPVASLRTQPEAAPESSSVSVANPPLLRTADAERSSPVSDPGRRVTR